MYTYNQFMFAHIHFLVENSCQFSDLLSSFRVRFSGVIVTSQSSHSNPELKVIGVILLYEVLG